MTIKPLIRLLRHIVQDRRTFWLCFLSVWVLFLGVTFAKYFSIQNVISSARAAAYAVNIVDAEGSQTFHVKMQAIAPGKTSCAEFSVSNRKEGHINEIAIKYFISSKPTVQANLPLTYITEKYDSESESWLKLADPLLQNNTMSAKNAQCDKYRIWASWDKSLNSLNYEFEIDELEITVSWVQID